MDKLWRFLKNIDDNILKYLLLIFVFLIPLYPKLPFKFVNNTYVAIRLEDFFVVFLVFVLVVQLLRRKITLHPLLRTRIFAFWAVCFLAALSGIYLTKTIDFPYLGFLHAARRVEYIVIFFIAAAAIRSRQDFVQLLYALLTSLLLVNIYGIGQRFFGFPAVSTMNPEFAKGHILILTPEARLASTFAGHYDLAAFLVLLMPVVLGLYLTYSAINSSRLSRAFLLTLFLLSVWILIMTASRTSYIAYMVSVPAFLLFMRKFRLAIAVVVLSFALTYINGDLITRFTQTFQIKQLLVNQKTGEVHVSQQITAKDLPAGTAYVRIGGRTDDDKETEKLRARLSLEASESGRLDGTSEKDRAAADAEYETITGFAADISFATRLQVEWPRAIKAFLRNPLLGSGPSSITEATDNNYLRLIGEFGALGTILFLSIFYSVAKFTWKKAHSMPQHVSPVFFGFLFGLGGLMINAGYIDVFEASKVAYILWYLVGIVVGVLSLPKQEYSNLFKKKI